MPPDLITAEHVRCARFAVANPHKFAHLGEGEAADILRTAWATLRVTRPDAALPPGHAARIVTIPRAVFQTGARPRRCPTLRLIPTTPTDGDAA